MIAAIYSGQLFTLPLNLLLVLLIQADLFCLACYLAESVVAYDVNDRISDLQPLEVVGSFGRMPAGCTSLAAYWLTISKMTT